ncbi:hypothetical protein H4582DRAFT_2060877 [Lactarius indigo]|nr:hypothetical protein H4582DRAFT_2060877 [Lactarius indigo]
MQSDHLSGSSAGESEVSHPSIHALGDRFSITSQDACILKGYVEEFQKADTEIRKTILEKAMGELYTLRPPNSTFNKKMAKMKIRTWFYNHYSRPHRQLIKFTQKWSARNAFYHENKEEIMELAHKIAKEWSEDRPPRDIQAKMAQAKFHSRIVRDFQTQLFKTCGMHSIVLVAYADTDGRPRAAMDDWNKVLDDGILEKCLNLAGMDEILQELQAPSHMYETENDQGAHSWRSKVLRTKVKIVIDTDGEPDIPSVTPKDGYSAKTIQTVLRDYCNSHILLNNISVPVARPLEAMPEGGVDPTNLEPVLNKEIEQTSISDIGESPHPPPSSISRPKSFQAHHRIQRGTPIRSATHFNSDPPELEQEPVKQVVKITHKARNADTVITERKSLHGKHVFHVSYYMEGMSSMLVTTRKSLHGSHYTEGISSVFGHYTESMSSVAILPCWLLRGRLVLFASHYMESISSMLATTWKKFSGAKELRTDIGWPMNSGKIYVDVRALRSPSGMFIFKKIILPLARVWRQPDVRKVIKQHIIVLKPNAFPSLYDWVSYPITLLIKSIYDVERKRIRKGLTPCHMHVELVAALEQALCFCHTGNAAVFATGLMGPLGLSKGALKDGFPMLQDLFEHPTIKQAMDHGLVIAHRKWPLKNGYPAMASKKAQVLSYSMRHFHVYGLSLIRGTF